MGNTSSAQQNHSKIEKLINSSRLNEAFLLLKSKLRQFPALSKELEKLRDDEQTYKYMLDYIFAGNVDPYRQDNIEQIKDTLRKNNDLLLREETLKDSSDIYSSTRRMFALHNTTLDSLFEEYDKTFEEIPNNHTEGSKHIITSAQSRILNEIFNFVMTMNGSVQSEYSTLSNLFSDPEKPDYMKAIVISAIILENLAYFDPDTFDILLNQLDNSDSLLLKARTAVGLVLITLRHPTRIAGNIQLRSRLMLSVENLENKELLNEVLMNIVRTYDTTRIDTKMRNEVIPGLMKIKPDIINKMKDITKDAESFLSESNPKWEEILENSDIGNKLREINDMQLEGADVMVTAFSNLKGFPFFTQPGNWFLPFTPGYYEFAGLPIDIEDDETIERLTIVMCDSDLHSFLLSMATMPEINRNQMLSNMQSQMKEAHEAMNDSIGETDSAKLSKKIRHTLQDLYRFFKFFRKKEDFNDPFAFPVEAQQVETLISYLGISDESLLLIAEFYFKNKYYNEAIGFFELFDRLHPGNFNIWEKIGFAYDRLQNYNKAVEWYRKAELVNPANPWLEKKLAISLKNSGNPKEALEYYSRALSNEPENYPLLMSAGQCYLALEKPEEALKSFYHAQYIKPGKLDASRAVAWAELMAGNTTKATSQYEKILSNPENDKTDFLNAAHVALSTGDFTKALSLYKTFVERTPSKDITELVIAFRDDATTIKQLGIKTSDLRLMVDKIRYDMSAD